MDKSKILACLDRVITILESKKNFDSNTVFDSAPCRFITSDITKLGWKPIYIPDRLKSLGYNKAYVAGEELSNGIYRVILCNESTDTIGKAKTLDAPGFQINESSIREVNQKTSSPGTKVIFTKSDFNVEHLY